MARFQNSGLMSIVAIIVVVAIVVYLIHQFREREDDSRDDHRERRGMHGFDLRRLLEDDRTKTVLGWVILIVIIIVVIRLVTAVGKGMNLDSWWDRQKSAMSSGLSEAGMSTSRSQYGRNW